MNAYRLGWLTDAPAATPFARRLNLEIGNFLLLAIHLAEAKHFVLLVIFCLYSLQTHIHSDTQTDWQAERERV